MARQVLVWSGLREYEAVLRQLPAVLMGEAVHLIEAASNAAAVEIKTTYPYKTGNLRRGVVVSRIFRRKDGSVAGAEVSSSAPHSHLYEYGTKPRSYVTDNGVTHRTGAARGHRVFVPRIDKARHQLTDQLKAIIRRLGLPVVGD